MKTPKDNKKLNVENKLEKIGVKKVKYYYHTTPLVNNVFTCCLFLDESESIISRGVAICSTIDSFNKIKGRGKSFSFALQAAEEKTNSSPINYYLDRWKQKTVTRTFRLENEKDFQIFDKTILPNLSGYSFASMKKVTIGKRTKMIYKIPRDYTLLKTFEMFKYKAMYKPEPIEEEKFLF